MATGAGGGGATWLSMMKRRVERRSTGSACLVLVKSAQVWNPGCGTESPSQHIPHQDTQSTVFCLTQYSRRDQLSQSTPTLKTKLPLSHKAQMRAHFLLRLSSACSSDDLRTSMICEMTSTKPNRIFLFNARVSDVCDHETHNTNAPVRKSGRFLRRVSALGWWQAL